MLYTISQDGLYGYLAADGTVAIAPQFVSAMSFSEGLAGIQEYGKWGFINERGEIVIEPRFDRVRPFTHGLALVEEGDAKQYIDTAGHVVIRADYYRCCSFEGELAPVFPDICSNGVFINRSGTIVLSENITMISHLSEGLINGQKDNKWGYMNLAGDFVIPPCFTYAHPFHEGLAAIAYKGDKKLSFIDKSGQVVIQGPFQGADVRFAENRCAVWKKSFGYIDPTGELIIPYRFYYAAHFSSGRAVIKEPKSKLYGYIDQSGEVVIPQKYNLADSFEGELAQVALGKTFESYKYGYIDRTGQYVWGPTR